MAGKSLPEIEAAMRDGFLLGGLIGTAIGGAGGALEARRLRQAMEELPELLVRDPEEFARRYQELVASLTPEQRAAWDTEMQGRRFVDAEHYGPAQADYAGGTSTVRPEHAYGQPEFRSWQEAAEMLDEHARTGQPLSQVELEAAHAAAMQHQSSAAPGRVRGPGGDVSAGGGVGLRGAWSALSPEQIALLETNPAIRLQGRGMMDDLLPPDEVARGFETAIIQYPEGAVVQSQLDEFFTWYNAARQTMDPTALAAAAQRRLVSIHPFMDGNGRVTRLVMDHALEGRGLPPSLLENPNIDYMVSEAEWTAHVRAGVVESYETLARHADLFNAAAAQFDPARMAVTWGLILGLTSDPEGLAAWLYPDVAGQSVQPGPTPVAVP
jgi:hypothetical protein